MTDLIVIGTKTSERGKPIKQYPNGRVCAKPNCITLLSKYNKEEFCWFHQPVKRPRLRGRMPSEVMEAPAKFPRCKSCAQRVRHWAKGMIVEPPEIIVDGRIHREGRNGAATFCEDL